jgi:hypothetical protein
VDYSVIPLWAIILYNFTWQAFCTCFRHASTPLSLILCRELMTLDPEDFSVGELFRLMLLAFIPLNLFLSALALGIDIAAKWICLGRRRPGLHSWDTSSYCQRWQLYLTLQEIRRAERRRAGLLDMLQGSQWLVWYFRALGGKIGKNVCLYPNGGGKTT